MSQSQQIVRQMRLELEEVLRSCAASIVLRV